MKTWILKSAAIAVVVSIAVLCAIADHMFQTALTTQNCATNPALSACVDQRKQQASIRYTFNGVPAESTSRASSFAAAK